MKELKEKCGLFAAWDIPEAAHMTYLGLFALQHRGQEGAGIVASDHGRFRGHRGEGLVSQVFSKEILNQLPGERAIGHVRYSTAGGSAIRNVQPIWAESSNGDIAIAHNGTLTNAIHLRRELEESGSVFQSYVDTEVILHLMAKAKGNHLDKFQYALDRIEGAYSLLVLVRDGERTRLLAAKDPYGFRPLVLGSWGKGFVLASESCAFDLIGANYIRELESGEILEFSAEGMFQHRIPKRAETRPCVFEWIYFSRPDSVVFGKSVYEARKKMGELLAEADQEMNFKADMVIGVPDSGVPAAIGYAHKNGLPFEFGLIRNHYIGRTFIEPHQAVRDFSVKIKQNPLPQNLRGKSVVVVDDSIIRGTTSKKIIQLLRDAGAREIHMRISAPPTISPCYYGIDTPQKEELIAAKKTIPEIADFIGANSLSYLPLSKLYERLRVKTSMCDACFTKNYPVPPRDISDL